MFKNEYLEEHGPVELDNCPICCENVINNDPTTDVTLFSIGKLNPINEEWTQFECSECGSSFIKNLIGEYEEI